MSWPGGALRLTFASIAKDSPGAGIPLEGDRVPDAMVVLNPAARPVTVRIHEDKYYTGPLSDGAKRQIQDYATVQHSQGAGGIPVDFTLDGAHVTEVRIEEVLVNFARPEGLIANESFVVQMVQEGVEFQVFVGGYPRRVPSSREAAIAFIRSLGSSVD